MTAQAERERREIDFWAKSTTERPGADGLEAFTNKMAEARVVLEKFDEYSELFRASRVILELGGGQCWTSTMVKRHFGTDKVVVGSDIAPDAIASVREWERVLRVELDGATACRSYGIPLRAGSVDLVVVFAAAHHFGAHRRTLTDLQRVLRPGGTAVYLHEPACRRFLHGVALRRVMAKRPVVPEDVLVYPQLAGLAREAGLVPEVRFAPTTTFRRPKQTLYYMLLIQLPWLQRLLPCCVDFVFTKPERGQSID